MINMAYARTPPMQIQVIRNEIELIKSKWATDRRVEDEVIFGSDCCRRQYKSTPFAAAAILIKATAIKLLRTGKKILNTTRAMMNEVAVINTSLSPSLVRRIILKPFAIYSQKLDEIDTELRHR